jgi:hypothetical protein
LKAGFRFPKSPPPEDFLAVSGLFRGCFASMRPREMLLKKEDIGHENRF